MSMRFKTYSEPRRCSPAVDPRLWAYPTPSRHPREGYRYIVTVTVLPKHLSAEELVKLLAIMDAQRTLAVDLVDDALNNPRAQGDANGLTAEQVERLPLAGKIRIILHQAVERSFELRHDHCEKRSEERGKKRLRLKCAQRGRHMLHGGRSVLDAGKRRSDPRQ